MKYILSIRQESLDENGIRSRTVCLGSFDSEKEVDKWVNWLREIYNIVMSNPIKNSNEK